MGRLYILTDEQIKSGKRPKTPRQKQRMWSRVCIVLTIIVIVETITILNLWMAPHG